MGRWASSTQALAAHTHTVYAVDDGQQPHSLPPRSRSAPANHVRRLLLLLSVAGAGAATCPDGTGGLTKALYDAGDPAAYAQVTCVPANEFSYYDGDVTLT